MQLKSYTAKLYAKQMAQLTPEQQSLVDEVYLECEKFYHAGGDNIVECFTPSEIVQDFDTIGQVRDWCKLIREKATNCRWGSDDDPQLDAMDRCDDWQ